MDLANHTFCILGGNNGVGLELVKILAQVCKKILVFDYGNQSHYSKKFDNVKFTKIEHAFRNLDALEELKDVIWINAAILNMKPIPFMSMTRQEIQKVINEILVLGIHIRFRLTDAIVVNINDTVCYKPINGYTLQKYFEHTIRLFEMGCYKEAKRFDVKILKTDDPNYNPTDEEIALRIIKGLVNDTIRIFVPPFFEVIYLLKQLDQPNRQKTIEEFIRTCDFKTPSKICDYFGKMSKKSATYIFESVQNIPESGSDELKDSCKGLIEYLKRFKGEYENDKEMINKMVFLANTAPTRRAVLKDLLILALKQMDHEKEWNQNLTDLVMVKEKVFLFKSIVWVSLQKCVEAYKLEFSDELGCEVLRKAIVSDSKRHLDTLSLLRIQELSEMSAQEMRKFWKKTPTKLNDLNTWQHERLTEMFNLIRRYNGKISSLEEFLEVLNTISAYTCSACTTELLVHKDRISEFKAAHGGSLFTLFYEVTLFISQAELNCT